MYNSLFFSVITGLCNHHHNLILEHFVSSEKNHVPISNHYPFSLPPSPKKPLFCFPSKYTCPGMVAHTCNPSTLGG